MTGYEKSPPEMDPPAEAFLYVFPRFPEICNPDIETLREYEDEQILPYIRQLELEMDIVKISYYDNKTAMESGDTAHYYSYYFLSNYEDG